MPSVQTIASLRLAAELSQEALARKAGLSLRTVQRAESGHASRGTLALLAGALGRTVAELEQAA